MKTKHYLTILLCLLAILIPGGILAQDEEAITITPYMDLVYIKTTKNQRTLNARLYDATDLGEKALAGQTIRFYTNMEDRELLAEVITDRLGKAVCVIPGDKDLSLEEDGSWWFYAEFEGSGNIEMTMSEIMVVDVNLEMRLTESEEEGRLVNLYAYTLDGDEQIPVTDEEIFVFVPRMFSLLSVGTAYLDEDGRATIEFPYDIPGDEHGKLIVLGKFHQHWQFANVEKRIETNWGIPSSHEIAETHRALWTQIAPLWMIITLSIMLAGVWGHYLYAIISLFRIKRAGKGLNKD